MLDAANPHILILAEQTLTERWAKQLVDGLGATVRTEWRDVARDDSLDVILLQAGGPAASRHGEAGESNAGPGLVSIGDGGDGDVNLPSDVTDRELLLACRLLTAITRARRQGQERVAERARLAFESRDPLTKLPDRGAWDRQLASMRQAALQKGEPLCVAILDLDFFKQINDGFGHAAGDDTLTAFARALEQSLRHGDFIARLGGDEFGLLLPGLDAASAGAVLERIRAGLPAKTAAQVPHVTGVSAGYAVFVPPCDRTTDSLYRAASDALRTAKRQGRGRTTGE